MFYALINLWLINVMVMEGRQITKLTLKFWNWVQFLHGIQENFASKQI